LVSKRRRLRRKDQAIAEVDSDKATLELPAEASGIITLKAEEDGSSRTVVCLIDTAAAKPSGSPASRNNRKQKLQSRNYLPAQKQRPGNLRFRNTISSSKKNIRRKNIAPAA
jgi:2-oxoglutarate dehydrogenase E2 component (dihydrolipoamide succinyltransferase)